MQAQVFMVDRDGPHQPAMHSSGARERSLASDAS